MYNTAYLSLGANIEPETNLVAAVRLLGQLTRLVAVSSVWETRPVGMVDQPNFLNAAVIVETRLTAAQLKQDVIARIEQSLGRARQADKNAPRSIDIDIIFFNDQIMELGQRHIPNPEVLERPFVAIPLAEIAPNYKHPETGQTLNDIVQHFDIGGQDMQLRPDVSLVLIP
jgi:2-amino-4-hydroxy-6-hydroxymethyldihydropteridine diphosphokinase